MSWSQRREAGRDGRYSGLVVHSCRSAGVSGRGAQKAGISAVRSLIAEGEPGQEIVAATEELDCDLVLLATHGRGGLGRALLGSVTDHVTRHLSSAATLIVPPAS